MSTKRLTNHNGRKGRDGVYSAKHNDRNYDVKHSKNVDPAKTVNNRTWHVYPEESLTFEEAEQKFYEENFASYLKQKNDRYIKGRHPERVQTMDEFRKNERTCPEEVIMQIGNVDDGGMGPDELWKLCLEQIEWEAKTFPNIKILDIALHTDEPGADHIHMRKVWTAVDDHGALQVNQTKALETMGIERPDTSKKKDRNNNAKMVYSKLIREHFVEVCKSHGIEIEGVPKEASETGLSLIELKNRGVEDILITCIDGLTGFPEAISAVYPKTEIQQCIIHQIRNSTKYVSYKDIKALMADLKKVYGAVNEDTALYELEQFSTKWDSKYPKISQSWQAHWAELSTYFKYPQSVRTLIYMTNSIENFNRQLRKVTKSKAVFPNDDSLLKMLYLAQVDITRKWTGRRRDWGEIHSQLEVFFADRLPE